MTQTHVTTNGAAPPESVTNERMVTPKRDRAAYMREYRARKSPNNSSQEFKDQINPEPELKTDNSEPQLH